MFSKCPQLWLGIAAFCTGCVDSTVESDRAYAEQLMARELQPGMTFSDVRSVLARHDANAVLQDGCGLRTHGHTDCAYSTVAAVPLPGHNWWLGRGDLQIFMVFDAQKQLLFTDYDLAYPRDP
jgi:hypothetical protein